MTTDDLISMHTICADVIATTQDMLDNPAERSSYKHVTDLTKAVRDLAVVLKRPLDDALHSVPLPEENE